MLLGIAKVNESYRLNIKKRAAIHCDTLITQNTFFNILSVMSVISSAFVSATMTIIMTILISIVWGRSIYNNRWVVAHTGKPVVVQVGNILVVLAVRKLQPDDDGDDGQKVLLLRSRST
jgi:hypothetical protein